tara:strand:+ start:4815 stop:5048 length:234 start_codon:yes stop_codon:yes gene_type:complete
MTFDYLWWCFKRTVVMTLLYTIACLIGWIAQDLRGGWQVLVVSGATWAIFFSVYVKDSKTDLAYYEECIRNEEKPPT